MPTSSRARNTLLATLLIVFYLVVALAWGNLAFSDESNYLDSSAHLHLSTFLHGFTTMPLYGLWYKLLALLVPDAIHRFFFSWRLMVAMTAGLPVLLGVRRGLVYTAVVLALSPYGVAPYVSIFAGAILLLGMSIVLKWNLSLFQSACFACCVCFLTTFARAEFVYGVFFAAGGAVLVLLLRPCPPGDSRWGRGTAVGLCVAIVLSAAMLFILRHSDTSRSGCTFATYFNQRAKDAGLEQDNPGLSSYAQQTFHVDTQHSLPQTVSTIGDFYRANPRLFLRYVGQNLRDKRSLAVLGLLLLAAAWPWMWRNSASLRPASVFFLLISLPVMADLVLIYPERHYITIIVCPFFLYVVQCVEPPEQLRNRAGVAALAVILLVLFIATTRHKIRLRSVDGLGVATIECLRELDAREPLGNRIYFDPVGIPPIYFSQRHEQVTIYELNTWNDFRRYTGAKLPQWVLEYPGTETHYGITAEDFDHFVKKDLHYSEYACPVPAGVKVFVAPQN